MRRTYRKNKNGGFRYHGYCVESVWRGGTLVLIRYEGTRVQIWTLDLHDRVITSRDSQGARERI